MDKTNVNNVILKNISIELESIAKNGLSGSNLDIAYKLIEMQYRLILTSKLDTVTNDCDFDYQQAKKHYRSNKCVGSKEEVIHCLNQKISNIQKEIKEMWNDSDFEEERRIIESMKGSW